MVEKKDIINIFSEELNWIDDKKLKEQVITVWKTAADKGHWEKIDKVPFTLIFENSGKLTDHTKRITHLVKAVFDKRDEKLNKKLTDFRKSQSQKVIEKDKALQK